MYDQILAMEGAGWPFPAPRRGSPYDGIAAVYRETMAQLGRIHRTEQEEKHHAK